MTNQFLIKNTVEDLRVLSSTEISDLQLGIYEGLMLLGYYDRGDTPAPIIYYLSDTSEEEDGGSVFQVGGLKLEHKFVGGVDVLYYGAKTDSDSTDAINKSLSKNNEVVISSNFKINPVKVVTGSSFGGGIQLNDNNILRFINGSYLYIDGQNTDKYVIINLRNTSNVTVIDGYVIGDIDSHVGDTGEYGFGYYIASAYNFKLINCQAYKCWGDGIIVTSDNVTKTPCVLGEINNVFMSDNRRQGMSIIAWDNGVVNGGVFEKTGFTKSINPSFGIDIEPNADGRSVINVVLNSPRTRFNKNGGILLTPSQMTDDSYSSKGIYNVTINTPISYQDYGFAGLRFSFAGNSNSWNPNYTTAKINGTININDSLIQESAYNAIKFDRWGLSAPVVNIKNTTIIDCNATLSNDRTLGSAIIILPSQVQDDIGTINIDGVNVLETREVNSIYTAVNIVMYDFSSKNINLKNINIERVKDASGAKVYINKSLSTCVKYDVPPENRITGSYIIPNFGRYNGETIILDSNGTNVTLPSAVVSGGYEVEFVYGANNTASVFVGPRSGDAIDMIGFTDGALIQMGSIRDRIRLKSVNGRWKVISFQGVTRINSRSSTDLNNSFINKSGEPDLAPLSSGEFYFDSTNRIWYKSIGTTAINNYIALNPRASTTVRGDLLQSAASTDTATNPSATYNQSEVQAILTELRDLKSKMRTAGILAT